MNNNRGNNRRRGRGNNNRQQGGGQPINRIDSRARGNAPQLLEKYRKMAHDAHLNGDRVTEEYYLQFADHYFRVLADSRQRQEEQRVRREERWQDGGGEGYREESYREGGEDAGDYGEGEDGGYDVQQAPVQSAPRRARDERPRYEDREDRGNRMPRAAPQDDAVEPQGEDAESEAADGGSTFEPTDNPFVRDTRSGRGLRPRRESYREDRRPRREGRDDDGHGDAEGPAPAFDPATLPPAISVPRDEVSAEAAEDAPKPRKRATRKPKPPADDAGETLATASSE